MSAGPTIGEVAWERRTDARKRRAPEPPTCKHCGAPLPSSPVVEAVTPAGSGGEFCCAGCAYVYRLIHESGFDAYYKIKDTITAPAATALLPAREHAWLTTVQRHAEEAVAPGRAPELTVNIQGISCSGCVWLIERIFSRWPGAGRIDVNAQTGQARLQWISGGFDAAGFAAELQRFNYLVGPAGSSRPAHSESRALAWRVGLSAAAAMNVMLFTLPTYFGMESTFAYARLFGTLSMAFATLSLFAGGGYFLNRAWRALIERSIHIDLPIALGIVGAFVGSMYGWLTRQEQFVYFDFVSAFILLMLVGRWAQTAAVERNQRRLLAQQPQMQRLRVARAEGNQAEFDEVAPEQLTVGRRYVLPAGGMVPVESRLEVEEATFNLAWINGESEPRGFRRGQRVPAGAQSVCRGEVALCATHAWEQSLLAQLVAPSVRGAFRHRLIERVIQGYLLAILGAAILSGVAWWWISGGEFARTGAVVVAVLVVSCPCALGQAFPLCDEIATVALRRRGVFVRAGDLWARLAWVRRVVFDKTGTLTLETPVLENPGELRALSDAARRVLCALVQDTPHPIARALHESLLASGHVEPVKGEVHETIGAGVSLGSWRLGRKAWALARSEAHPAPAAFATVDDSGETWLTDGGRVVARFLFRDAPRANAARELAALADRGLDVFIVSGDHADKVMTLARELGLPAQHAFGGCSPRDKVAWLERHHADAAMMLGDGANDSLAFDRALCRGTPVVHRGVLEQKADFYYLGRGIEGIRALFEVNDARRRTQAWLLAFMILYNVVAVGLAVAGHMDPLLAAILMPASSLLTLAMVGWGMRRAYARAAGPAS